MVNDISLFSYIEEALNRVFPDNAQARAEYEALLEAAKASKSFWRPIEECPKERGKEYFLLRENGIAMIGQWDERSKSWHVDYSEWPEMFIAYYAEIPPLPEKEIKS